MFVCDKVFAQYFIWFLILTILQVCMRIHVNPTFSGSNDSKADLHSFWRFLMSLAVKINK